jgi:uncharacterized OB-fold protein
MGWLDPGKAGRVAGEFRDVAPSRTFRDRLQDGELAFQECHECERAVFPPRLSCTRCGALDPCWRVSEGHGIVYSVTVVAERAGPDRTVCLVDLAEGFRMMSTVVGMPAGDVAIGMAVRACVERIGDEDAVVFRTASA